MIKMSFETIEEKMGVIVKGNKKEIDKAIKELKLHFEKYPSEPGIIKQCIASIDMALEGKRDPTKSLIDLATGRIFKGYKLSEVQRKGLQKFKEVLLDAPKRECEHKNLAIIALIHGGGFFPQVFVPELVCLDCNLNVSLKTMSPAFNKYGEGLSFYGLKATKNFEKDLDKWINTKERAYERQDLVHIGVEEILRNPQKTLEKASKFPIPQNSLKIEDKEKLEHFTGV